MTAHNRTGLRTTIAIETKALVLGDSAGQGLAAALAAGLREAFARVRWLSVLDSGIWLPGMVSGLERAKVALPSYQVTISVLRADHRIRVGAELKQVATAQIIWVQRYDRETAEDAFDLVDRVAAMLAAVLDREVHLAETMRVTRQPTAALSPTTAS